jgi:hypothetical protein
MKADEFERLFDQAMAEAFRKHDFVPDPEPSWTKVRKQLERRSKRRSRLIVLPYIAVSFIIGAFLFGTPATSQAFPFFHVVKFIQEDVVKLIFGSGSNGEAAPKTLPPPNVQEPAGEGGSDSSGLVKPEVFENIEEAGKRMEYKLPRLEYLPAGYEFERITAFVKDSTKADTAAMFYRNGQNQITINVKGMKDGKQVTSTGNTDEGTVFKQIAVNGREAYLFQSQSGISSLNFLDQDVLVTIIGLLSEDEMVKIVEGMSL